MATARQLHDFGFEVREDRCPDCQGPSCATRLCITEEARRVKPWTPQRCGSCAERVERERAVERDALEREVRLVERIRLLNVPKLYESATLESFELHGDEPSRTKQHEALAWAREYLKVWPDVPNIAVFMGVPGSGKGHIVWSIARRLVEDRVALVRVAVLSDVVRDLREAWHSRDDGNLSEAQRLERYRNADLLVIDEVSQHAFYGQPRQHLYDLVDWRETRCKPTILTTNEAGQSLLDFLGPALASRASGWGAIIDFGNADFRVRRGKHLTLHGRDRMRRQA